MTWQHYANKCGRTPRWHATRPAQSVVWFSKSRCDFESILSFFLCKRMICRRTPQSKWATYRSIDPGVRTGSPAGGTIVRVGILALPAHVCTWRLNHRRMRTKNLPKSPHSGVYLIRYRW
jgi:hypothetical protein